MKSQSELQQIIKDNANLSEIEHWYWFTVPFSDEWVFIVIDRPFIRYVVNLILFDKPYKKVESALHVGKVSVHSSLGEAKGKAESVRNQLQNLYIPRTCLLAYLKDERYWGEFDGYADIVARVYKSGIYRKSLTLYPSSADDYLKPLDVIKISRGLYHHVGIYLGNNWVCQIPGEKSGNKGTSMAQKETLNNFFLNETGNIVVCRSVVPFKEKEQIIQHIARSIVGEFGKGEYDLIGNNCEHFANALVFGMNFSLQTSRANTFSKEDYWGISFKNETEACANFFDNLKVNDYNELSRLTNEIRGLAQESTQANEQQALIQVNDNFSLQHEWCKIQ